MRERKRVRLRENLIFSALFAKNLVILNSASQWEALYGILNTKFRDTEIMHKVI